MKNISVACTYQPSGSPDGAQSCQWPGEGGVEHLRTARTIAKTHVEHTGHTVKISVTDEELISPANIG